MNAFVLPVFDRYLICDPLVPFSALTNRAAVDELRLRPASAVVRLPELVTALRDQPADVPAVRQGPLRPLFFALVPTRGCNLRCAYCGFGASRPSVVMTPVMAVCGIDWMAAHAVATGRETLDIHFFGGEPIMAFDVVETAVHRTRALAARYGLRPQLEIATNGVYDESAARFVGDYFQTTVLSLDGFEAAHNRHRAFAGGEGSFRQVLFTARILSDSPTRLCLRICVAADNVEQLPEAAAWLGEAFQPAAIDFETLQPTTESERAGLLPPDPYRFALRFLESRRILRTLGVEAVYAASAADWPRLTFCPVGRDALILPPDGRLSGCYLQEDEWKAVGLDLLLGWMTPEGRLQTDQAAVDRVRALTGAKPRCRTCFCRWSCAGGCHVHQTYPGCAPGYTDFCLQTRLITACLLLEELGFADLVEELIADPTAREALARAADDRLAWAEACYD